MRRTKWVLTVLVLMVWEGLAWGDDYVDDWKYRVEVSGSYEHVTAGYGEWGGAGLTLWYRSSETLTIFLDTALWRRNNGLQGLGGLGVYHDWDTWLYTFTSVYMGTKSEYNPLVRVDHEFNFKLGPGGSIVGTAAFSYVKEHNDHYAIIPQVGLSLYIPWWVFSYRFFANISYPGRVFGPSHLISVEFGSEGRHWTYLSTNFGKSAYLATYVAIPEKVDIWMVEVHAGHRQWLAKNWGLYLEVKFMRLFGEYDKYGLMLGFFYQWGKIPLSE